MPEPVLAISSTSNLAVEAGREMALLGGNAVDAAVSAALVSLVTEPGVVAIGGGGYITVWPTDSTPITLDGYMAVPGLASGHVPEPTKMQQAVMEYGGGVTTLVGHASVCTPGGLAALEMAVHEYGSLDWAAVMQPAIRAARDGFPLSQACHNYLIHSHAAIFSLCEASRIALHDRHGRLLQPGETVFVADLSDSLSMIAEQGSVAFYQGELARQIIADMESHNGSLDADDLGRYKVEKRTAFCFEANNWRIATNPPPAIGGATLGAMFLLMQGSRSTRWDAKALRRMVDVQQYVLGYRRDRLDHSDDLETEVRRLLNEVEAQKTGSPSTVHTSAVDTEQLGCSVTLSAGYGSGIIAKDTGIWLNNSLGELELNRKGAKGLKPGMRMLSNMAPTVARKNDGTTLAIGSPGADRITTAIAQTLISNLTMGMSLKEAIEHPRLHLEWHHNQARIAYEDLLDLPDIELPTRSVTGLSMYFGGVGAASYSQEQGLSAATDPRRTGAALIVEK